MKPSRVAIILGGILISAGIFIIYPTRGNVETYNDTVLAGQYTYIQIDVLFEGRVSGDYRETNGRSLELHVYDTQQFLDFSTSPATPQGLFSASGVSGLFSAAISMPGKYYLVLDQAPGNEQITLNFALNLKVDGTNTLFLVLGAGLIAGGAVIAFVGYRAKKKSEPPAQAQGVVLFDQSPPPAPPQQYMGQENSKTLPSISG